MEVMVRLCQQTSIFKKFLKWFKQTVVHRYHGILVRQKRTIDMHNNLERELH